MLLESIQGTPIYRWLELAVRKKSSDLHLVSGYAPTLRTFGKLTAIEGEARLQGNGAKSLIDPLLSQNQERRLQRKKNLDFAFELQFSPELSARFRGNVFCSHGNYGACIRVIPNEIPDFVWTQFPETLAQRITQLRSGLVLFTGVTGSGKSTSLALIVEMLNKLGGVRILTIEDPIEYRFPNHASSIISQREVGTDVRSFADGLRYGLRQDPDVILVGEIRDKATARMALNAAETGHLVLSTLHTRDAKGAITRYADLFPQSAQSEVRTQLASFLEMIVCQKLLPSILPGEKQELAQEVMINTPAIGAAIRSGKLESVDNYIMTGRSEGMIPMDESIKRLWRQGYITQEIAEHAARDSQYLLRS